MVSGQAPNADTRDDCSTYAEFTGSAQAASDGQVPGAGCVYPNTVLTVADQVTAAGKQWKAYLADMGDSTCVHPNSNAAGDGELPGAGIDYDTQHNPFVYFHSLLDLGGCSSNDVAPPSTRPRICARQAHAYLRVHRPRAVRRAVGWRLRGRRAQGSPARTRS